MRRTRYVVLPVRSWQYCGLLVVSLACLTLGLVSRDREGRHGSLVGPELMHTAPHDVDACPNSLDRCPSSDASTTSIKSASPPTSTQSSRLIDESRSSIRSGISPSRERQQTTRNIRSRSLERQPVEKFEQHRARSAERRDALASRSRNLIESRVSGPDRREQFVDTTRTQRQLSLNRENRRVSEDFNGRRMSRDARSDTISRERLTQRQSRSESRFPSTDETRIRDIRSKTDSRDFRLGRKSPDNTRLREFRIESRRVVDEQRGERLAGGNNVFRVRNDLVRNNRRYHEERSRSVDDRQRELVNTERQRELNDRRQRERSTGNRLVGRQQRISSVTEQRRSTPESYRRASGNRLDSHVDRTDRTLPLSEPRQDIRREKRGSRTRMDSSRLQSDSRAMPKAFNDEKRVRSITNRLGPHIERVLENPERRVRSLEPSSRVERSSSRIESRDNQFDSRSRHRSVTLERRIRDVDNQRDSREERTRRVAERRVRSVDDRYSSHGERRSVDAVSRARSVAGRSGDRLERRSVSSERRGRVDERRFDPQTDRVRDDVNVQRIRSVENRSDSRKERRLVDVQRHVRAVGDRIDSRMEDRSTNLDRRVRDGRTDSQRVREFTRLVDRVETARRQVESRTERDSIISNRLRSTRSIRTRNDPSLERRSTLSNGNRVKRSTESGSENRNIRRPGSMSGFRVDLESRNAEQRARSSENRSNSRMDRTSPESRYTRVRDSLIEDRVRDGFANQRATIEKRQSRMMENRRVDSSSKMSRDKFVQRESSDRTLNLERRIRADSSIDRIRADRVNRDIRGRKFSNRLIESKLQRERRVAFDESQQSQQNRNARKLQEVNRQILNFERAVRQFEANRSLNRREKGLPSSRNTAGYRESRAIRNDEPAYFLATQRSHLKKETPNVLARRENHKENDVRNKPGYEQWKQLNIGVATDSQYLKSAMLPANQTMEILRQSVILTLCAVYGMKIFSGKSGFFRSISQYTDRLLTVW